MSENELLIGGNFEENKAEEVLQTLRSNRPIIVMPTNDSADESPALKKCDTIEKAFEEYKPSAEIPVKDADGASADHRIRFTKITDFSAESIVDAVPALRSQKEDLAVLTDLRMLIKNNPKVRKAADNPGEREKLIACLQEALKLLESTKH